MIRVNVICEGQTEEMFVNNVLADVFQAKGIYLFAALIGKPGHKGGNFKYARLLTDLKNLLNDKTAYCTTFFDFYGLPEDFPGKQEALKEIAISKKANKLTETLMTQLHQKFGDTTALNRFIPYVQMYEFEALLFSNPTTLAESLNLPNLTTAFQKIRNDFDSPEEINNSFNTAPSKRIEKLFSDYEKPINGSLAALDIGLDAIRQECKLFDNWLSQLEALPIIENAK
jgi:hypothetical protein